MIGVRADVIEVRKEVEPILSKETEQDTDEIQSLSQQPANDIDSNMRQVLSALANSKYTIRTVTGISRETHLNNSEVLKNLHSLRDRKLVGSAQREKRDKWYITDDGRRILAK